MYILMILKLHTTLLFVIIFSYRKRELHIPISTIALES